LKHVLAKAQAAMQSVNCKAWAKVPNLRWTTTQLEKLEDVGGESFDGSKNLKNQFAFKTRGYMSYNQRSLKATQAKIQYQSCPRT